MLQDTQRSSFTDQNEATIDETMPATVYAPMGGMVLGGAVFYEATEAERILQGYARIASAAPDEFTTQALLVFAPPAPFIPPALLVAIGERKHALSPIRS